jgi:hypothetical protein
LRRYADPYNEGEQRVIFVNALLGIRDGMETFVIMDEDQESHMYNPGRAK